MIDAHANALPLGRHLEMTSDRLLVHQGHLRTWLARGVNAGENRGIGHIRWGKVHKGLTGKLAELTARYAGPLHPKGHLVRIELSDGKLATGYSDATGRPLSPEIIVPNKAKVRSAMTDALRAFGAATRF